MNYWETGGRPPTQTSRRRCCKRVSRSQKRWNNTSYRTECQDEKYCIACNIVRTKCKQFHTKILVVKILDNHPSARHNTSRFGRVCDPLTRFPLQKRTRLISQSLGFRKKTRSSSFARFPTNPLVRKINQVQGG